MPWRYLFLLLFLLCTACGLSKGSPFATEVLRKERDVNIKSAAEASHADADGVVRIAIVSDSHYSYKQLDDVIRSINSYPGVDFVVHLGDFAHHGLTTEYDQFMALFSKINYPAFAVLGNHDVAGDGERYFETFFGTSNHLFESQNYRFVLFNSNNRADPENYKPTWLKTAVASSSKDVIIFSHIPLEDRFYSPGEHNDVISDPQVKATFAGHIHRYTSKTVSGTILVTCPTAMTGDWLLVEIIGDKMSLLRVRTQEMEWVTLKN